MLHDLESCVGGATQLEGAFEGGDERQDTTKDVTKRHVPRWSSAVYCCVHLGTSGLYSAVEQTVAVVNLPSTREYYVGARALGWKDGRAENGVGDIPGGLGRMPCRAGDPESLVVDARRRAMTLWE